MSATASLSTLPGPMPDRYWRSGDHINALRSGVQLLGSAVDAQAASVYVSSNTNLTSSGTIALSSLVVQGAGIVTAGMSSGKLVVSATAGGGDLTVYGASNTTQGSSGTYPGSSVVFAGAGIASVGMTNGSVVVSVPLGGGAGDGYNIIAAGSQTAPQSGTVVWADSNGVSFGMSGSSQVTATVRTDYASASHTHDYQSTGAYLTTAQPPGAYLTTAAATDHSHGAVAVTGSIGATSASSGLSLSIPAFLTTAAGTGHTHSDLYQTTGAYLTTALGTGEPHIQGIVYSNATQTIGSLVLSGSNGITVRSGANTAIIEFDGHHLDGFIAQGNNAGTAFASMTSGTVAFNFAGAISGSQNGNALTVSSPVYLATAAQSDHTHGSAPSLTGPVAVSSSSAAWSLNVNAIGNTTAASNVTWTVATSGLSLDARGYAGTGTTAANASLTLNSNGLNISVAAPGGGYPVRWVVGGMGIYAQSRNLVTNLSDINTRPFFVPFEVAGYLTADEVHWTMSRAATGRNSFTLQLGVYSISNSTRLDLIASTQVGYVHTSTASCSGIKGFESPMPTSQLTPGQYVLAWNFSAVGNSTSAFNYSLMGGATTNQPNVGVCLTGADAYHNYTSHPIVPWLGRYTANSAGLPASVAWGDILHGQTGVSHPIPLHFMLVNHY